MRSMLAPKLINFALVFAFDEQRDRFIELVLRSPRSGHGISDQQART